SASAADILSRPGYDVHRRIRRRSPRFMPIRLGRLASIKAEYAHDLVSSLREEFDTDRPLEGKIIVVDAAHGALQDMPEIILGAFGAKRVIQHRSHNLRPINQGGVADIEHVRRDILSHPEL